MRVLRLILAVAGLLAAVSVKAQTPDATPQWTLPAAGLLNGSKAEIESKLCCGASSGEAVRGSDRSVLAAASGMASRDGKILNLKLADRQTFKLTDCDGPPACTEDDIRVHRLVAWWPKHRLYVVSVGMYEDTAAYLVSERDGRALVVTAPPALSPSGRMAVALVSNLMAGVDLEVIDLSRDPPTVAKVTDMPRCPGFTDSSMLRPKPVWIDESHVRFDGVSPQPGDNPNTKQLLRIVDGNAAWEC